MTIGEGASDPVELTFPVEWTHGHVLTGQAQVLGIDGQPLDMAEHIDPRSTALIRQADAIAREYERAAPQL